MAQHPTRPFESLDWYRDAARHNFQSRQSPGFSSWAQGLGMLHAHISVFAVGSVALCLLNAIRTPDSFWVGRWIVAWMVLVLIHGVVTGFIWAIRQWDSDDVDEPVWLIRRDPEVIPAPESWARVGDDVQDAEFRDAHDRAAAQGPAWSGWNATGNDTNTPTPSGERTSWRVAAAAAWLERDTPASSPTQTPPPPTGKQ
jgi:hypothetical protein